MNLDFSSPVLHDRSVIITFVRFQNDPLKMTSPLFVIKVNFQSQMLVDSLLLFTGVPESMKSWWCSYSSVLDLPKNWWCYEGYTHTKLAKIGGAIAPPDH